MMESTSSVQLQVYRTSYNTIIEIVVDGSDVGSHDDVYFDQYHDLPPCFCLYRLVSVIGGSSYGGNTTFHSYFHGYIIAAK